MQGGRERKECKDLMPGPRYLVPGCPVRSTGYVVWRRPDAKYKAPWTSYEAPSTGSRAFSSRARHAGIRQRAAVRIPHGVLRMLRLLDDVH